MSLGSNEFVVQWGLIGSYHCEKFQFDFMARTCALIALVQPVLQRDLCAKETLPNATKYNAMHQNMSLESNAVDRVRSLRKIPTRLRGMNFCTSLARFELSVVTQQTVPNAPNEYEMDQNMSLGSNAVDRVRMFRKIPT